MFMYAASLPFFGVIAEVGVQITPVLVISLGMLIALLIQGFDKLAMPKVVLIYMLYVVSISITMSFFLPAEVLHYPALRGRFRWISQLLVFALLYTPLLFVYWKKPSIAEVFLMSKGFIWATIFLCLTGFLQLYIYNKTGKDLFPINMFSQIEEKETIRSALSRISETLKVFRVSALGGGEPKHFGYSCVVALNLHLLNWLYSGVTLTRSKLINLGVVILFLLGILLSLSTQAYLLLGLDIVILTFMMLITMGIKSKRLLIIMMAVLIGGIILVKNDYSNRLIETRIYERLTETGAVEDFNETIIRFLESNPGFIVLGTGLGSIHFWAIDYIPKEFRYYMKDSVFVAKAGVLRIVSEQGIVGLILFLCVVIFVLLHLWRERKYLNSSLGYVSFCFLIIVILDYFVSSDSSPYYVFAILFGFAVLQQKKLCTV